MLESSQQVRPLSPAAERPFTTDGKGTAVTAAGCIKCCGCIAALLLVQSVVAVTLAFTVFKLKSPIVRVEKPNLDKLDLISGSNMTLNATIRVKNPNFASFRYGNMTTTVFYRGTLIGELRGPPGMVKARRTVRINVSVDLMWDRILSKPGLGEDMFSGLVNVSSYTRVRGRMNLFIFEKRMIMKMKCSVSINVTSKAFQHHKCKRKIKL